MTPNHRYDLAKAAMQGFCANPSMVHHTASSIADLALHQADAMLALLNIKPEAVAESQQIAAGIGWPSFDLTTAVIERIPNA